jgi:hypothetical protein
VCAFEREIKHNVCVYVCVSVLRERKRETKREERRVLEYENVRKRE